MNLRRWIKKHSEEYDDLISSWYWRKKYNSLSLEIETLKEVMASDVYSKVIKNLTDPLETRRIKRENSRLRNLLSATREERDYYKNQLNKKSSQGGKKVLYGKKERGTAKQSNK
jgi:hypothetical protein